MPTEHAKLSPSSAERWISCPASVHLETLLPKEEATGRGSIYAEEGTAAHALGEIKASLAFGKLPKDAEGRALAQWRTTYGCDEDTEAEMLPHVEEYVHVLKDRVALYEFSNVFLEQKMDSGVPACWGTSDAVIVSPEHIEIVDFKYGQGIPVEAKGNPQLRLYALGALDTFGDILGDTQLVRITVHQPRLHHVLTDEMTPADLRAWRERIIPIAEIALTDHAPFGPSAAACRWCPASGRCKAQLDHMLETDFGTDPDLISPAEMGALLAKIPEIKQWLSAFEEAALTAAYARGEVIPGYKVVLSGGQRKITDTEGATSTLLKMGYEVSDIISKKIKGIGELEKLLGEKRFAVVMEPYLTKSEGRPSLVEESDKRDAITGLTDAQRDFDEEIDDGSLPE